MAKTRFGLEGYGVRRAGSFAGKTFTAPPQPLVGVPFLSPGVVRGATLVASVSGAGSKLSPSILLTRTVI